VQLSRGPGTTTMSQPKPTDSIDDDGESFADRTPLVELLGDHARPRILDVLAAHRSHEFNVSELARHAGVSRNTIYDHIDALEAAGAVEARAALSRHRSARSSHQSQPSSLSSKSNERSELRLASDQSGTGQRHILRDRRRRVGVSCCRDDLGVVQSRGGYGIYTACFKQASRDPARLASIASHR